MADRTCGPSVAPERGGRKDRQPLDAVCGREEDDGLFDG